MFNEFDISDPGESAGRLRAEQRALVKVGSSRTETAMTRLN